MLHTWKRHVLRHRPLFWIHFKRPQERHAGSYPTHRGPRGPARKLARASAGSEQGEKQGTSPSAIVCTSPWHAGKTPHTPAVRAHAALGCGQGSMRPRDAVRGAHRGVRKRAADKHVRCSSPTASALHALPGRHFCASCATPTPRGGIRRQGAPARPFCPRRRRGRPMARDVAAPNYRQKARLHEGIEHSDQTQLKSTCSRGA
jgi:hypothetical protein